MDHKQTTRLPHARHVRNGSLEFDPVLDHIDGCEPFKYSDISKIYQKVPDENDKKSVRHAFRLDKVVRTDSYCLIHPSKQGHNQILQIPSQCKGDSWFSVACSPCTVILKKSKKSFFKYRVNEEGFLDDPQLHHLPGCSTEDITERYSKVDNDVAKQIISRWYRKDDITMVETKPISIAAIDHRGIGVEVAERKLSMTYLYRIPDSGKCLIFNAVRYHKNGVPLICNTCRKQSLKRNGNRDECSPGERTSDGFSLKYDPLLDHRTDCKPLEYSEILKKYRMLEEERPKLGEYEFPLAKTREIGTMVVIHKLKNDPTKCYIFNYHHRGKSAGLPMHCSYCLNQKSKPGVEPLPLTKYRVTETGFLDDPSTGHHPNCTPFCYETTMKKNQLVDEQTARAFINGTYEHCLITDDQKDTETDFPVMVVQKRNAVCFVYPMSANGYVFHQLKHGDNSRLFCATCLSPGQVSPNKEVAIRNSDGHSMEADPRENHLKNCKPRSNRFIWNGNHYIREDGAAIESRKYEFPLVKRSMRETYLAIYRLRDDLTACYSFKAIRYVLKSRWLRVECFGCSAARRRQHTEKTYTAIHYRVTSSGFLDDPALGHVSGCQKLRFEDIMKENVVTAEQESRDFFKHVYSSAQNHGVPLPRRWKGKDNSEDEDIKPSLSNEKHQLSGSTNHLSKFVGSQNRLKTEIKEEPSDPFETGISEDNPITNKNDGAQINEPISAIKSECSIKFENEDERLSLRIRTQPYSKMFDIPFFTKDEVSVSLLEQTITVKCQRQGSALGVTGGFLSYSIDLAQSIDISTLQTIWDDGRITITAQRAH